MKACAGASTNHSIPPLRGGTIRFADRRPRKRLRREVRADSLGLVTRLRCEVPHRPKKEGIEETYICTEDRTRDNLDMESNFVQGESV